MDRTMATSGDMNSEPDASEVSDNKEKSWGNKARKSLMKKSASTLRMMLKRFLAVI